MIGEQWNTLVAQPTERELEAAMASVRVRALEHWKRRIWRGRAWLAAAFVIVAAVGAAGGRTFGASIRLLADQPDDVASSYRTSLEPTSVTGAAPPGDMRRFHLARRTDMDGIPIIRGDAWIEGPEGTEVQLSISYEGQRFSGSIVVATAGDSMIARVLGTLTRELGWTANGGRVSETIRVVERLRARAGQQLRFYPFGTALARDGATTAVIVEGPWAALPAVPLAWRDTRADSARFYIRRLVANEDPVWLATRRPIRYAFHANLGMNIVPRWLPPDMRPR